ncbi:hypothetical protein [Pseudoxanthomonas suwonensis]|uniref:hypothetical protein n=1 Tax=Pseudoxanthomonas suwonensis TaxID=314722 RepID=UPI00118480D6|nr:hypothetical protein [Pseudoxanthomonas suwonensis]
MNMMSVIPKLMIAAGVVVRRFAQSSPGLKGGSRMITRSAILVAIMSVTFSVLGQVYTFETHGKEIDRASKAAVLPGFGQFGDGIDYFSGVTTFRKTLVEIPGNNNLRVAADYIVRLYTPPGGYATYMLERDIPYIEGVHSTEYGWVVGYAPSSYTENRCSDPRALMFPHGGAATVRILKPLDNILPSDYWDGNSLYTPDAGGGLLRPLSTEEDRPTGFDSKWATNEGWRFSCYQLPGGGEGFVGHSPNGDKYYFGAPEAMGRNIQILSPNRPDVDGWLDVDTFRMYVTRIEDRFGNWVSYGASGITSSDGRAITLTSNPSQGSAGAVIQTNGKQWSISGSRNLAGNGSFAITNPDGSVWDFSQTGIISPALSPLSNSCSTESQIPSSYSGQMTVQVQIESGAKGVFVFQPRRQGFSDVWFQCDYALSGSKEGQNYSNIMHFMDEIALKSRTVSGPGLASFTHTIDYGDINACYSPGPQPAPPNVCGSNSPRVRNVTISGTDGSLRTLTFGNQFYGNAGLLLGSTEGGLRSVLIDNVSLYENTGLPGKRVLGYDVRSYRVVRPRKMVTTESGRSFISEVPSTCGSGGSPCFDERFRPTKIVKSSEPSP